MKLRQEERLSGGWWEVEGSDPQPSRKVGASLSLQEPKGHTSAMINEHGKWPCLCLDVPQATNRHLQGRSRETGTIPGKVPWYSSSQYFCMMFEIDKKIKPCSKLRKELEQSSTSRIL